MSFTVDIVTPEKVVQQTQADSLVIPAWDGELGILKNHAPLIAALRPGEIRMRRGNDMEHLAVSGGFVEVRNNHVRIFAEAAELAQEIDIERARQAAEKAKAVIRESRTNEVDLAIAEASLRRALTRLHVAEGVRRSRPTASH